MTITIILGSLDAWDSTRGGAAAIALTATTRVAVVPTAAAFSGATAAARRVLDLVGTLAMTDVVPLTDRAGASDPELVGAIRRADVVVLTDGSSLHAKSVWRDTLAGEAIRDARTLVAVGSGASALFEVMIDPRGGAPTVGLGYRRGVAVTTGTGGEQLSRTRSLLGATAPLVVLGTRDVLVGEGEDWRVVRNA